MIPSSRDLPHPLTKPRATGMLDVGDGHVRIGKTVESRQAFRGLSPRRAWSRY